MSDETKPKPPGLSSGQILKLVMGILVFGALMGIRPAFEQMWLRTLVAACAGGVLGWALLQARRRRP
jgi:hypothetical protein